MAFAVVTVVWLAAIVVWRSIARRADVAEQVTFRLSLHRGLTRAELEAFLAALSGLRPPWWRRWIDRPAVVFEVHSRDRSIEHRILVADRYRRRVEAALQAHLQAVRVEEIPTAQPKVTAAAEYRLSSADRVLRVDDAVARLLLNSLTAGSDEVTVQWVLAPAPPPPNPFVDRAEGRWFGRPPGAMPNAAAVAAANKKLDAHLLWAVLRIGVSGPTSEARTGSLRHVEAALHSTTAPGVHIRRRMLPKQIVARRLRHRHVPSGRWPMPLNTTELSGLLGWPFDAMTVPGLTMAGCRPLPVSSVVPATGSVIGDSRSGGTTRAVAIDLEARLRHLFLLGGTGSGKTSVMCNLAVQDAHAGRSVLLIDPKADLIDGFLASLDARHHARVVVVDLADARDPVGIDPFNRRAGHPELAVEQLTSVFHRIYDKSWGVRTDDCLRAGLRTLLLDPEATLAELPALFSDPVVRDRFTKDVTDPVLVEFWRWYSALSDAEAASVAAPLQNKLRALLSRPALRRTFCQARPRFDLAEHLDGGGIVAVSLNSGTIGEDAANLFAGLLVGQVWDLIQRRALQPESRRRPTMVFLDELQRYVALPLPMEELFAQARAYRVGITAAAQHLGQLPTDLRRTVLSTPRSRIAFQAHGEDASILARLFGLGLTADDLGGLDAFEVVAQLHAGGRTQPAATLTTRPAPARVGDPRSVRDESRQRWGVDGAEVDRAIADRLARSGASPDAEVPTGRKRRRS